VTVPLDENLPTYPHNTPFTMEPIKRIAGGDSSNLSTLHMSAHSGTHVDAPRHFFDAGPGTETLPLELLVASLAECPGPVRAAARDLVHNGVVIVGVGYETPVHDDRSWLYFPGDDAPFYRVTNFAKYSPANVPGGDTGRYCSYMTETSYSDHRPVSRAGLEERVEAGLRATALVDGRPRVASVHVIDVPYAYPVPTPRRDAALGVIQPWLMERGIYSRGRFGSWKYEIGNMDHAVKMGVDVARRVVRHEPEELWSL